MTGTLLVLGGTAFLGRAVSRAALADGTQVTALARGVSGDVVPGVRLLRTDREEPDALAGVSDQDWDVVLDLTRQPGQARRAAQALAPRAGHYVYVSSVSAYAADAAGGRDEEDTPLWAPLEHDSMGGPQDYGPAKVAAERAVVEAMGSQGSLLVRAGIIGGPGDDSGRSAYWPWRFSHPVTADGAVLVPRAEDQPLQLIDVRDLARWILDAARHRLHGPVDVVGPGTTLAHALATAREVTGHRGPVLEADADWLVGQGVRAWAGDRSLPLWLGGDRAAYPLMQRSGERARASGLQTRQLGATLADELDGLTGPPGGAGLAPEQERALLAELRGGVA